MVAPKELIHDVHTTGSHVLTEQMWFAARETLAIQLFNATYVDREMSSWVIASPTTRDAFRKDAQDIMYGELR